MSAPLIVVAVLVLLAFVIIARTVNIIQQGYVGSSSVSANSIQCGSRA